MTKAFISAAFVASIICGAAAASIPADTGKTAVNGTTAPILMEARRGRGADDPAGHIRGGHGADDPVGHASTTGLAPAVGQPMVIEARRGRGADDPAGHVRGGHGADDPVGHG
jgi:hypothetical protein